jgi:hypothetical protein
MFADYRAAVEAMARPHLDEALTYAPILPAAGVGTVECPPSSPPESPPTL